MDYNFRIIEKRWQDAWREQRIYHATENAEKPKFYVLDMFPYPSGAGLHVGHPLGYIASDIFARYKRQKGFNVLHPMGYDAFGLPAEQYAIQTGQHPAVTTQQNIARYRQQLDKLGFSFDWEREVRTADPKYYKWTQWVFIKLFNHYYDYNLDKAQPIDQLVAYFEKNGSKGLKVAETKELIFTADEWNAMNEHDQQEILLNYRLAYIADTWVNWCPQLGTVLANDEVVNGVSERGGYPVERKLMKQWMLRVSAYSERLLKGLENLEWSDSIKEIQRNWIGRSEGAFIRFEIEDSEKTLDIFTTRPDTIFGVSFMVMCPEHSLIEQITTPERKKEVESYVTWARNRAETERQTDVKKVSGIFTGAYCINPFTKERIPIWVAEYVLAGYGTGGIMAVPAHDSRDYAFAKHFNLPIREVIEGGDISQCAFETKEGTVINSDFISGMKVKEAGKCIIEKVKEMGIGYGTVNYRLRDAIFSRQRYWGEPFPIYYKNGIPYVVSEDQLPVVLPQIDEYKPTAAGDPPLARAVNWKTPEGYTREYNTMPGFAGSSGYYIRYMDPHNDEAFVAPEKVHYWQNVDLYVGGSEHATGHLIYSRFWNKFLFDLGYVCQDEPYRKLINQGMIQGRTNFVYRINGTNTFVSLNLKNDYDVDPIRVDVNIVHNDILDQEAFKQWRPEYANAEFILEGDKYVCGWEIEKMSKSKYNVQNPDDLVDKYGADTLRLYEMFLGPIEVSKPWDTNGIEGVFRFMKKMWKLYHDANNVFCVIDDEPTREEYKALHKVIKKVEEDNEKFSFNTAVSAFMIAVNELTELKCHKRKILEPLAVLIAAYAPHIAEELWHLLGHSDFVVNAPFPSFDAQYLVENTVNYPVSFNGKVRLQRVFPTDMSPQEIESIIMQDMDVQKYLDGKSPKKVIIVPKRIINIVI